MKATVSQPQSWKRIIDVEIPPDELDKEFHTKLSKYKSQLKLPGFRPGKAPSDLIKTKYGKSIRAEIIEDLIQKCYESACKDNNITPISQAKIDKLKAEEGQPVTFSIETEVDPHVEIEGYQKLKVKVNPNKIKSNDVDKALEELQRRLATFADVDRPSKKGDFVTVEYVKVIVDDQERPDIKGPQYPVEVGASTIREFDKGLAGRSSGETADLTIPFPKDYADKEIAGKKGDFTIKITKVQERNIPEVNDEFLKKLGDFVDEKALRDHIQKDLEARELERVKNEGYNKAIDILIKENEFEIPPSRVEQYIDYMYDEVKRYSKQGEPLPSREEVAQRYRENSIRSLKRYRIIDYIATKENIRATQEEVDRQIEALSKQYNQPFDKLKAALRQNGTTNRIRMDIREQKTLDYLIGELTVSAEAPAAEEMDEKE